MPGGKRCYNKINAEVSLRKSRASPICMRGCVVMRQSRLSAFLQLYKKDVIGFGIYYGVVGAAAAIEVLRGWNLTLPMLLLLVVVLACCVGGRNYIGEWQIYQDNPMAATEFDQGPRDYRALPLVRSLLMLLPPLAYFIIRLLLQLP